MSTLDKYKTLRVLVGVPSNGQISAGTFMCLQNMTSYVQSKGLGEYKTHSLIPFHTRGSILSRGRLQIVKAALKEKATHILFVDGDQTFPRDTLHRLVAAKRDVIGCNIATKTIPASPTARRKDGTFYGGLVYTDPPGPGTPQYEKVWRLGTGIMLVNTKVFEKLGLNCWEILWKEEIQDYQGEDWRFCELLEQFGIDIWVDHYLSNEIGHLGEFCFGHDLVGTIKEEVANG